MADAGDESDFVADATEKVNNANSDTSNRSKLKRNKSDTRRSHRSKSSSSRKSRSVQKMVDARNKKESKETGDRLRFERRSSLLLCIKKETHSDDQTSSVSDNRPLLLTRSRIRKIERRKAYSSASSTVESSHRKTKSEPILITLDSDSDDNVSLVSNRPNRTARIRGELIRKLSRTATTKLSTYKASDYSSSSEGESVKRKKKSKSVKTSSSSQASKRKKYLVSHLSCQSRLKLRKHRKPHISHVFRPLRKRRDLRSIRKRFEEHKKKKQKSKSPVKKSSPQTPACTERRTLRSTSIEVNADSVVKHEVSDNLKMDVEIKPPPEIKEKTPPSAKKSPEVANTRKQTNKDVNVAPVQETEISSTGKEEILEKEETAAKGETAEKEETTNNKSIELAVDLKVETTPEKKMQSCETNAESTPDLRKEPQLDLNIEPDSVDLNPDPVQPPKVHPELPSTIETNQETIASSIERMKESVNDVLPNTGFPTKMKKMKKKIKPGDKILRKRGRPRLSDMKPVKKIPILNDVIQLPFLQNTFCFNIAPKLPKCRECRIAVHRSKGMLHAYCRFMEYRKLCYSRTGCVLNAGFSEPTEATPEHLSQWLPQSEDPPKDLNCNTSKALLEHIGDQFCDLLEQEKEALTLHIGNEDIMTWKRIVQGVREMCDVCFTTLFNFHWVCPTCGLAVCIDCYKGRKQGITIEYEDGQPKNRDQYNWLLCSVRQPHDPEKLVMAQIIPGNALWTMKELLHKARDKWNIPSYCKCNPQAVTSSDKYITTGICKQLMCSVTKSFSMERSNLYFNNDSNVQNGENNYDDLDIEVSGTALKWLEGNVVGNLDSVKSSDDFYNTYEDFASLRDNLLDAMNGDDYCSPESEKEISSFSMDDIIADFKKSKKNEDKENSGKSVMKHFSNRYPQPNSGRDPLPIRIYTKLESNLAFSNVPHSWYCNGRLLFLHQSDHPDNLALFQEQWKRGQPILVKAVDERLSKDLWHPDAFCRDFGEVRNDLIDCRTGAIIKNLPMKRFWEGFESFSKRLKDDDGEYMLLKLKDWPPGEDFSEMLPRRFEDLMKGLPLPEYTHRDGILNLAGRLPPWFVRPDLGPKMYNAYGSALYPTKGTTNLHLDISDAVNVMVYVGIPQDGNAQLHIEEALKAIDEGGCDSLMRARVRGRGAKPGALWHIYNARDADKIREMLTKVAIERREKLEAHHDPIHDQSWYLDAELRKRLYRDYGVEGYAIAQCLGDAVFIPAGAPHQVRNLHSCVKVAEDFVSPENIAHCFKLTQEFRHLSDTHTNHEDKLQIKNIIYHVVRDALAHLLAEGDSLEN